MHFEGIKKYLSHMRNARYKILTETAQILQFEICNAYCEKLFTVHFRDETIKDRLSEDRPVWHHYYLQFEQENVPFRGRFSTIREWKWYREEEDVLARIRTLKNRYNY